MASAALQSAAQSPARAFRVMLRSLTSRFHLEQAHELLCYRSATDLELLADDVNTVLASCLTGTIETAVHTYLATVKRRGLLLTIPPDELVSEATAAFMQWDHGLYPDLIRAIQKRGRDADAIRGPNVASAQKWRSGRPTGLQAASTLGHNFLSETDSEKVVPVISDDSKPTEPEQKRRRGNDAPSTADALSACDTAPPELTGVNGEVVHQALARPDAFEGGGTAIGDAYKRSFELLREHLLVPSSSSLPCADAPDEAAEARWANARLGRALKTFRTMKGSGTSAGTASPPSELGALRVSPNARSYALLLHGALMAGAQWDEQGRDLLARMTHPTDGVCPADRLWEIMQPCMLGRLWRRGWLSEESLRALLCPEPDTLHWAFLKAAWEAGKGDQYGSKHGATVTDSNGKTISHGRNHRFGLAGDPHYRVMHSEVHALVRILERQATAGSASASDHKGARCSSSVSYPLKVHVLIVELDGCGVGYEVATPCAMCAKGLCRLGACRAVFSGHAGIATLPVSYKPALVCESLEMAVSRVYPDGTTNPDIGDDAGFDFFSAVTAAEEVESAGGNRAGRSLDPGKGRSFARHANVVRADAVGSMES